MGPILPQRIAELIGNRRRILVSDLSGRANLQAKARELNLEVAEEHKILDELKRLEHEGFEFEAAEASFELMVRKLRNQPLFASPWLDTQWADTYTPSLAPGPLGAELLRVFAVMGELNAES